MRDALNVIESHCPASVGAAGCSIDGGGAGLRPDSWILDRLTLYLALLYCTESVLSLYLDERRGVQGNTSMRSREFPRAQPKGNPNTKC